MTKIKKIYQINRTGELVRTFDSAIECAAEHKITRAYIYRIIGSQTKLRNKYYLTFTLTNRLAKFSDDKIALRTIETIQIMANYRDNLIIHLDEYGMVLKAKDKARITKEINNVTRYLKNC